MGEIYQFLGYVSIVNTDGTTDKRDVLIHRGKISYAQLPWRGEPVHFRRQKHC